MLRSDCRIQFPVVAVFFIVSTLVTPLRANPVGGEITSGAGSIVAVPGTTTVTTSTAQSIIQWQDFSIQSGELTKFIQPNSLSSVLNRVIGGNMSSIYGTLQSNGQVFLVNPNGILIGAGGVVDTAGFVASTLNVSDSEFLNGGGMKFVGPSLQTVTNLGKISASEGNVILIAQSVVNQGEIHALSGTAGLYAGQQVYLAEGGSERGIVQVVGVKQVETAQGVTNSGLVEAAKAELKATGNLYALAINNTGVVRATGTKTVNGTVYFSARGGMIQNSGQIVAKNGLEGGLVKIEAQKIKINDPSVIDVSGERNGGTILVGGDTHGANPEIENAKRVVIASGARLIADGGAAASGNPASGNGGKIVVWSDEITGFYGEISAKGGELGGNGGFVETSGKGYLDFRGTVNLLAARGEKGTLLLDPTNININSGPADLNGDTITGDDVTGNILTTDYPGATSNITGGTINTLLASTNLVLAATNNINVNYGSGWSAANSLTLNAGNAIILSSTASMAGGGNLNLVAGNSISVNGGINVSGGSSLSMNAGSSISSGGGYAIAAAGAGNVTIEAPTFTLSGGSTVSVASGTLALHVNSLSSGPAGLQSSSSGTLELRGYDPTADVQFGGFGVSPGAISNYSPSVLSNVSFTSFSRALFGGPTQSGKIYIGALGTAASDIQIDSTHSTYDAIQIQQNVSMGTHNLTVNGNELIGGGAPGTVSTTTGNILFNGNITLLNDLTVSTSGGSVTVNGTVDGTSVGGQNVTVTPSAGAITLNGAVGSTVALGDVTLGSGGTQVHFNNNTFKTAGNIMVSGTAYIGGSGVTIASSAGNINMGAVFGTGSNQLLLDAAAGNINASPTSLAALATRSLSLPSFWSGANTPKIAIEVTGSGQSISLSPSLANSLTIGKVLGVNGLSSDSGSVSVYSTGTGDLILEGDIKAAGGTKDVTLVNAFGGIISSGGGVFADHFAFSAGNQVTLDDVNEVNTLGGYNGTGSINAYGGDIIFLNSKSGLTIDGSVSAGYSLSLHDVLIGTHGDLTVSANTCFTANTAVIGTDDGHFINLRGEDLFDHSGMKANQWIVVSADKNGSFEDGGLTGDFSTYGFSFPLAKGITLASLSLPEGNGFLFTGSQSDLDANTINNQTDQNSDDPVSSGDASLVGDSNSEDSNGHKDDATISPGETQSFGEGGGTPPASLENAMGGETKQELSQAMSDEPTGGDQASGNGSGEGSGAPGTKDDAGVPAGETLSIGSDGGLGGGGPPPPALGASLAPAVRGELAGAL